MNKFTLLLLTLSISLFAQDLKIRNDTFPATQMKTQNVTVAKMSAAALSKDLPQTIDKYTTLQSVTSQGPTMIYTFLINSGSKSDEAIKNEDKSRMKKAITTGVCQSARQLLKAQIDITYIYLSTKTKAELFSFNISQKDCVGI